MNIHDVLRLLETAVFIAFLTVFPYGAHYPRPGNPHHRVDAECCANAAIKTQRENFFYMKQKFRFELLSRRVIDAIYCRGGLI